MELNYTGGAETIAVSDATGGKTTVTSTQGETVTFVNPTNSFKLTASGGADTINVNSLAANYRPRKIPATRPTMCSISTALFRWCLTTVLLRQIWLR